MYACAVALSSSFLYANKIPFIIDFYTHCSQQSNKPHPCTSPHCIFLFILSNLIILYELYNPFDFRSLFTQKKWPRFLEAILIYLKVIAYPSVFSGFGKRTFLDNFHFLVFGSLLTTLNLTISPSLQTSSILLMRS